MTKQTIDQIIDAMAADIKDDLKALHALPPATKNYYGSYLTILQNYMPNEAKIKVAAIALIRAGANRVGVFEALQILNINVFDGSTSDN